MVSLLDAFLVQRHMREIKEDKKKEIQTDRESHTKRERDRQALRVEERNRDTYVKRQVVRDSGR